MLLTLILEGKQYAVDLAHGHDLCLPVRFDMPQLAVFGAAPASSTPLRGGSFVGSVREGGSCNCGVHTFSPHTAGTHTECVGHITDAPVTIYETLRDALVPATLITLKPVAAQQSSETYRPALRPEDMLLTAVGLAEALRDFDTAFQRAVLVRTTPNRPEKATRNYNETASPFFSAEAMLHLHALDVEHLLVDMPSIDRLDDEGILSNHRVFWSVPQGSRTLPDVDIYPRTVTELIYAPDPIPDGHYLLNLQVAPLLADAAPSRPVLYPVRPL
jgi:kynurenine formamidase